MFGHHRTATKLGSILILALLLTTLPLFTTLAQAQSGSHVVQTGDSLSTIAQRYGVSTSALASANGISNHDIVRLGQRLAIPGQSSVARSSASGSGYFTVRTGDTLSEIAQAHGMTTGDLMRLNGLSDAGYVWVGQKLRVSARVAPSSVSNQSTAGAVSGAIHIVQPGQTLSQIAQTYGMTTQQLMSANGLPNPNFVWVGQRLRVTGGTVAVAPKMNPYAPPAGKRMIEVNLSRQTLTAWNGKTVVMQSTISSGNPWTPTITGRYLIDRKYPSQHMTGPGYDLPGVPWVMYFWEGYAFHGAYWHNNFGQPMSHGCVHLTPTEAKKLYDWTTVGTEVYVHY